MTLLTAQFMTYGYSITQIVAGVAVSLLSHDVNLDTQEEAGRAIRRLADTLSERLGANLTQQRKR